MIKAQSYLSGLSYSIAFNIFSKALLFFTNLLIAYLFGASSVTDLYFYLFSIILMVANFVIGLNGSVIIPESRRLNHQVGKSATYGFVNLAFYTLFAFLILTCIIITIFPTEILSIVSQFDEDLLRNNKRLIYLAALLLFFQVVVSFFNDLLVYYRYFILPSIITSLNGILTVAIVLAFHARAGIDSILIGSILAYVSSLALQAFILLKYERWHFFEVTRRIERRTLVNALYSISSITVSILVTFVPFYFLSTYAAGSITQFVLAQRISEIPNTLLAIQFVTIIGVQFTEKFIHNNLKEFNEAFLRAARVLHFILIPIAVTGFFLSSEIVAFLLEHGSIGKQALDIEDLLAILMIGVPFTGLNYLTTKALVAAQKIKSSFYFNVLFSVVNIAFSYVGISLATHVGYAWAVSLYAIAYFLGSFFLLRRTLPFIQYGTMINSFLPFLALSATLMFVILKLYEIMFEEEWILIKIIVTSTLHVVGVLSLNHFLKLNSDIDDFVVGVFKKIKVNG